MEKLFGIWKRRFPVLAYGCHLNLDNTLVVIIATAVLHNIARTMNEEEPPIDDNANDLIAAGDIPAEDTAIPALRGRKCGQRTQQDFLRYFENMV